MSKLYLPDNEGKAGLAEKISYQFSGQDYLQSIQDSINDHSHFSPGNNTPKRAEIPHGLLAFVRDTISVKDYVKQAFEILTGESAEIRLPSDEDEDLEDSFFYLNDMSISIMSDKDFDEHYFGLTDKRADNYDGFADDYKWKSQSGEVYVRQGSLVNVMQAIGHEIGHLMAGKLRTRVAEEAKAYAFQCAWCQVIHDNQIAGLGSNTIMNLLQPSGEPHRSAFNFVKLKIEEGHSPMELFYLIAKERLELPRLQEHQQAL